MISTLVLLFGVIGGEQQPTCADYDKAPYEASYNRCMKTRRPLLALLGAPWCPACPHAHVFVPRLHQLGEYGYINCEKDKDLAQQVHNGPIPCLVVYRNLDGRWVKEEYVGAAEIEKFVKAEEEKPRLPPDFKPPEPKPEPKQAVKPVPPKAEKK
jgi:glutaredoxin-related protein